MNGSKISVRYARALYDLSVERNIASRVQKDVQFIYEVFRSSAQLVEYLNNPVVKSSEKRALLHKIFSDGIHVFTLKFLDVILDNKREDRITDITRQFISLFRKQQGITEVNLITATEVGNTEVNKIIGVLAKGQDKVEVTRSVNPELMGGFILRINDRQLDASVLSQLRRIRKELTVSGYQRRN